MSKTRGSGADRSAFEQRREHALRDLEELAQQVEDGEIAEAEAAVLEARYRKDLEAAESRLGSMPKPKASKPGSPGKAAATATAQPANTRKILLIMGATLVALTVGIVIIANLGGDEPTQAAPPDQVTVPQGEGSTLEQMEAVLADHPDSNGMRLAIAGLYFDEAQYLPAMEHYTYVLEHDPLPEEEIEALSRIGWMAHITGQPETAVGFLEQAVALDPAYGEAKLFLGVVLLYGTQDVERALPLLEEVLALPDLPDSIRPDIEAMADEARAILGDG